MRAVCLEWSNRRAFKSREVRGKILGLVLLLCSAVVLWFVVITDLQWTAVGLRRRV